MNKNKDQQTEICGLAGCKQSFMGTEPHPFICYDRVKQLQMQWKICGSKVNDMYSMAIYKVCQLLTQNSTNSSDLELSNM